MDQIMGFLQPIIDAVSGLIGGGEGGEGFDPASLIEMIKGFFEGIIGGGAA